MLMWNVVKIDDVEEVECRKHVHVIQMPSPGLRHIRVGGLASHIHTYCKSIHLC